MEKVIIVGNGIGKAILESNFKERGVIIIDDPNFDGLQRYKKWFVYSTPFRTTL